MERESGPSHGSSGWDPVVVICGEMANICALLMAQYGPEWKQLGGKKFKLRAEYAVASALSSRPDLEAIRNFIQEVRMIHDGEVDRLAEILEGYRP